MKRSYRISRLAELDLEEIWMYSYHTWSKTQADNYYHQLFKSIDALCKHPEQGISIDDIKQGHRKMLVNSHMIIYKYDQYEVWIDRILHQRMDIEMWIAE